MPHEIRRLLSAFTKQAWFIDPREAEKIVAVLMVRGLQGPRALSWPRTVNDLRAEAGLPRFEGGDVPVDRYAAVAARVVAAEGDRAPARDRKKNIVVLNLIGPIVPRVAGIDEMSGPPAASLERFNAAFDQAAASPDTGAIVLNIDSPGGVIDMVPETAAKIRSARNASRPIIAVANPGVASAAYWIASAGDELVVTDSGEVGGVGVWSMHQDISEALAADGVRMTLISEGARKVEGNPFEPLGAEARKHLQDTTRYYYDMFVADVARHRGVDEKVVRADPESGEPHFGGGRTYPAHMAVKLGMADKVESLESVLRSLQNGKRPIRNRRADEVSAGVSADMRRRRLALI
jgi:ClpP class serine protease